MTIMPPKTKKRNRLSPEEQLKEERCEKYKKLMHQSTKTFHKEAKVVKSFETKKLVRKLKETKATTTTAAETRLEALKNLSLDHLVRVCLHRLGMFNLIPEAEDQNTDDRSKQEKDEQQQQLVELMLKHKRLTSAMDVWNAKVTEFRRWYLRRQDVVNRVPFYEPEPKKKTNGAENNNHAAGLFVNLSGAAPQPPDAGEGYQYGPGQGFEPVVRKKNRQGQRGRRAKAMAIQAKKEGRYHNQSFNWREKKQKDEEEHQERSTAPKPVDPAKIAEMGKTWQQDGQAHPSWAAKQSKKVGIAEFKGKKITFD